MMKKIRLKNPIEYRGFIIKEEGDFLVLYDRFGNYVKRKSNLGRGTVTDLKYLADKYIAKGAI